MKIIVKIGIFFLNIIYSIIKIFPTKNKVTFISRQSNLVPIDFVMIGNELEKENIKIVYLCKKLDNGFYNKLKYTFHMFRQMYHIATSKVVILDSYCMVISLFNHKKTLKVIQMWHALGAFKKFGLSIIGKKESESKNINIDSKVLNNIMKMHRHYDYIFASSDYCICPFSEAFGYDKKYFRVYPLPRLDNIINKNNINKVKLSIYKDYPILKKKKNILYAPTFRKNDNDYEYIKELIEKIDYKKYNLILKLHPLTKYSFDNKNVLIDTKYNTYEMGMVSDYIITDYSAVIFELILLNKPIYFYAYDKENYINGRDFYLNYDTDLPGKIFNNINNLLKEIENNKIDNKKMLDFKDKYISEPKVSYTKDIVDFINKLINNK